MQNDVNFSLTEKYNNSETNYENLYNTYNKLLDRNEKYKNEIEKRNTIKNLSSDGND